MTLPGSSGRLLPDKSLCSGVSWDRSSPCSGSRTPHPPSSYGGEPSPVIKCAAVETPSSTPPARQSPAEALAALTRKSP